MVLEREKLKRRERYAGLVKHQKEHKESLKQELLEPECSTERKEEIQEELEKVAQVEKKRKRAESDANVKQKYGITLDKKEDMRRSQGDKCKVCHTTLGVEIGDSHADHKHGTDRSDDGCLVQGILCCTCNYDIISAVEHVYNASGITGIKRMLEYSCSDGQSPKDEIEEGGAKNLHIEVSTMKNKEDRE